MLKWKKLGTTVHRDGGVTTTYVSGKYIIERRKLMIPCMTHSGSWARTTYFLIADGEEKEFQRLKDAKVAADEKEMNTKGIIESLRCCTIEDCHNCDF